MALVSGSSRIRCTTGSIRKSANIILTNPEMLNSAFLPNHSKFGFDFIFSNLKYIVIDELHSYRGAFGAHLANLFRPPGGYKAAGYCGSSDTPPAPGAEKPENPHILRIFPG